MEEHLIRGALSQHYADEGKCQKGSNAQSERAIASADPSFVAFFHLWPSNPWHSDQALPKSSMET